MEDYSYNDPRIRELISNIIEKIFTVCLLSGLDSDAEFQQGCQIVIKLTSLLQEISTFPSEFLADGVKQLLEQQLPDVRIINNFPAFQTTLDRMLRQGILKVTDSRMKEVVNSTESTKVIKLESKSQDSCSERLIEASPEEVVTDLVIPGLTDAYAIIDELTLAEKQVKADALTLTEALTQAETKAVADSLALIDTLTQAENQTQADALALTEALTQAEAIAKAEAYMLAEALAEANVKFETVTEVEGNELDEPISITDDYCIEHAEHAPEADNVVKSRTMLPPATLVESPTIDTSTHTNDYREFIPPQVPTQADFLERVLFSIFPKGTIFWNKKLMGQTFLAQVEDILIYLDDSEHPCNLRKFNKDGWKVLVFNTEDLAFPRRLERKIRLIQRSGKFPTDH